MDWQADWLKDKDKKDWQADWLKDTDKNKDKDKIAFIEHFVPREAKIYMGVEENDSNKHFLYFPSFIKAFQRHFLSDKKHYFQVKNALFVCFQQDILNTRI